jgi:dienelactone hydrolase
VIGLFLLAAPLMAAPLIAAPVTFDAYSPLTRSPDYLERVLTPLGFAAAAREAQHSGRPLGGQLIDLSREHFVMVVPASRPPAGYGLLVFIPPWEDARVPVGWAPILEQQGIIFVSAGASGNGEKPLARRLPLALLAAYNVMQRYAIDPQRAYVGGFSGGARVALTAALDFPDVFTGALLDAGSDPIGESPNALPAAALLARFQDSRIVYLTGSDDTANIAMAAASQRSLKRHCVFRVQDRILPWLGHAIADGRALSAGLRALSMPTTADADARTNCRAELQRSLDAALDQAQALLERPDPAAARRMIAQIDGHFGALATPRILELAGRSALDETLR